MLKVILPNDSKKLDKLIKALKYQISVDTCPKDKEIHEMALKELVEHKTKLLSKGE